MNVLKQKNKRKYIFLIILFAQIGYLLIYNLFKFPESINFDSSEYLVQVIQIWRQKTLLINDYYYSTMLTWDMPTMIAVIFYGITKNVFLSYGIANCLLIIIFALGLNKLCDDLGYSHLAKYIVMISIFTIYDFGIVNYIEELFVNGALYGIRLLLMLMLMDVLICCHKNSFGNKELVIYIICLFGFLISGISTGIFEAGCCILPLCIYEFMHCLLQNESFELRGFFKRQMLMPVISLITSLMGVVINHWLGLKSSISEGKMLVKASNLGEKFINNFIGIFQLYGWPSEEVSLISARGILAICSMFVAIGFIVVAFVSFVSFFRRVTEKNMTSADTYVGMVIAIVLVNTTLFNLVNLSYSGNSCEFRYWLLVFIPIMLLTGYVYDNWMAKMQATMRGFITIVIVLVLVFISVINSYRLWNRYNRDDEFKKIMNCVDDAEVSEVFIYSDYYSARVLSTYQSKNVTAYAVNMDSISDDGRDWVHGKLRMPRWGTYVKHDGDCMSQADIGRYAILIDQSLGYDVDYLISKADTSRIIDGTNFVLCTYDEYVLDFIQGFTANCLSRDYFNQGYDMSGFELNEDGDWISKKGSESEIVGNFIAEDDGQYSLELVCDISGVSEKSYLELVVNDLNGDIQTYKTSLQNARLENVTINKGSQYTVRIKVDADDDVLIKHINYIP